MKNLNKIILALAAVVLPLASCQKVEEWKPGEMEDGPQVYFSADTPSSLSLSSQESSFAIDIYRVVTSGALTVNLSVSGDTDPFTIPSSVSFGAGENKATIDVEYDADAIGFDSKKTLTFNIADDSAKTMYGASELKLTVEIPSPWTLLGKGSITDYYYMGQTRSVNIYQNDLNPNVFRLDSPFVPGDKPELTLLQPGDVYKGVTITKEGLVGYTDIDLTLNTNYNDEVYMVFPGRFTSKADESLWTYNKVLAYQENGLPGIVQLAPMYYMFNTGGWDKTQLDGQVEIVFPGYVIKDYSVSAEYSGIFTDPSGVSSASTNVTLGADVEEVKLAVVAGNGIEAAAMAIAAGTVESVSVSEDGVVNVPIPEDADFGEFSVVAVSFAEGEAQEIGYSTFQYFGGAPADDLVAGKYNFGKDNVLTVESNGGYEYIVQGLGVEDESAWWAVYDPTKNTLSVTGVEYGYEDYGNEFGGIYGYWDDAKTQVYAYCSYADADSEGDDPLVFNVDPATHAIVSVANDFSVEVFEYKAGYPFVEYAFQVAAGTAVTKVAATSSATLVKAGNSKFGVKMFDNEPAVKAE